MEEIDVNVVDDNDISYGKSNKGLEVIILNDSEIFHKRKIGKTTLIIVVLFHGIVKTDQIVMLLYFLVELILTMMVVTIMLLVFGIEDILICVLSIELML